jgi:hypothetical protein
MCCASTIALTTVTTPNYCGMPLLILYFFFPAHFFIKQSNLVSNNTPGSWLRQKIKEEEEFF